MSSNPSLKIIKEYSKWSFAIIGNTYKHKDVMKRLGGKYNKYLKCGAGWIFKNTDLDKVSKTIKCINKSDLKILINSITGRSNDYNNWSYSDLLQRYESLICYE